MDDMLLALSLLDVVGIPLLCLAVVLFREPVRRLTADVTERLRRDRIYRSWTQRTAGAR